MDRDLDQLIEDVLLAKPPAKAMLDAVDNVLVHVAITSSPKQPGPGEFLKKLPQDTRDSLQMLKSEDIQRPHRFFAGQQPRRKSAYSMRK